MNYKIHLEVLTPTHVGMGSDKKLLKGLDFIYDRGTYKIFNQSKLLSEIKGKDVFAISSYLADENYNDFTTYLRNKNLLTGASIDYEWQSPYECENEIRCAFRDGSGKYFIPGSSIKGALRSIIGTCLWNRQGNIDYNNLMGTIDNNLMRFLQVTDCYIDQEHPGIYPIKVFSADKDVDEKFGSWKNNSRGGHETRFNTRAFVTFYEMLTDGLDSKPTAGEFRIDWGGNEFVRGRRSDVVPNIEIFNNPDKIDWLWKNIKTATGKFLESETHFFESYHNDTIDDHFFDELNWLTVENNKDDKTCLMRLGANVGWHSITGNWKFNDFSEAVESNRGRLVGGRELAYKTRKIGFDGTGEDLRFFLPGFVKLTLV